MKTELLLKTKFSGNKTFIDDVYFTSPIKIAQPIYKGKEMSVILMSATAGILSGDEYEYDIDIGENCDVLVTGQSFTKIFKMDSGKATNNTTIKVGENATLKYYPKPIITFANSRYIAQNKIYLTQNSTFIYKDIFASGRVAMGEQFQFDSYKARTSVYIDDKLVFLDNANFEPDKLNLTQTGFFEGYTHQGLMYVYSPNATINSNVDMKNIEYAITECKKGIVVRCLANSSEEIETLFDLCYDSTVVYN